MSRRRKLPAEPFQAVVNSLDAGGSGLLEHDGRQLRVFGALPQETISARYLFGRRFKGQAQVLEVLRQAEQRVEPACPLFGTCGGCALQHMNYEGQLLFKQGQMLRLLEDSGGVRPERVLPPLTAGPWAYRRKARLSVRDVPQKGRVLVGFREQDGRFVVDMQECHTLDARIAQQLGAVSDLLGGMDARGSIPQIEACCGDHDCAFIFRHLDELSAHDRSLLNDFAAASGIQVWLQAGGPDTTCPLQADPEPLTYELPRQGISFQFKPLDFVQVNAGLNSLMIEQAMALLELGPEHRVLDLFCGLGNFSLPLAQHVRSVVGIEGSSDLVERAAANALLNGISNVRFHAEDLYSGSVGGHWHDQSFDRVLIDPPRSGAGQALPAIAGVGAEKLLYVSCNPKTLAEDAGHLVSRHGFELAAAGIMDMFPQTAHIESMALFVRGRPQGSKA